MKNPGRLFFIHGWATDGWVWEETARTLAGGDAFYNINLPGHGGLERWDEPTLAPALREVSRRTSGEKGLIGVGWSLGAEVLIRSAVELKIFRALVLVGATPCFVEKRDFPWGQPGPLVKRMIMEMRKDPAATLARFYGLNFTGMEKGRSPERIKKFIERYSYPGPVSCGGERPGCFPVFDYGGITNALTALYEADLRGVLGSLDMPVLVIHGRADEIVPPKAGEYLAGHIRGARLKIFEGSAHAPFITDKDLFEKEVTDFLGSI